MPGKFFRRVPCVSNTYPEHRGFRWKDRDLCFNAMNKTRLTGNQVRHISVDRRCFYRFGGTGLGDSAMFVDDDGL